MEALSLGSSAYCRARDVSGLDLQTESFVCLLSNRENALGPGSWFQGAHVDSVMQRRLSSALTMPGPQVSGQCQCSRCSGRRQ